MSGANGYPRQSAIQGSEPRMSGSGTLLIGPHTTCPLIYFVAPASKAMGSTVNWRFIRLKVNASRRSDVKPALCRIPAIRPYLLLGTSRSIDPTSTEARLLQNIDPHIHAMRDGGPRFAQADALNNVPASRHRSTQRLYQPNHSSVLPRTNIPMDITSITVPITIRMMGQIRSDLEFSAVGMTRGSAPTGCPAELVSMSSSKLSSDAGGSTIAPNRLDSSSVGVGAVAG